MEVLIRPVTKSYDSAHGKTLREIFFPGGKLQFYGIGAHIDKRLRHADEKSQVPLA